jgi:hypothetical protein
MFDSFDPFDFAQDRLLLRTSLQVDFGSVRSCGLRTDKTRQGRNAATVV